MPTYRKRGLIGAELRERLSEAQNHRCAYCGCDIRASFDVDHVPSWSQGGTDDWENLVAACVPCNRAKHDRDAYWFFDYCRGLRPNPFPDDPPLAMMIMDTGSPVFRRRSRINDPSAARWLKATLG